VDFMVLGVGADSNGDPVADGFVERPGRMPGRWVIPITEDEYRDLLAVAPSLGSKEHRGAIFGLFREEAEVPVLEVDEDRLRIAREGQRIREELWLGFWGKVGGIESPGGRR
jgi:hypothetical protein